MGRRNLSSILKSAHRAGEVINCMKCTNQWLELTMMYLGLKKAHFPFQFKTRSGQKIELNTFHDLVTVWVIFCRHEYKIPKNAKVVIDAGANIGTFSVYAAGEKVEKIYAIEPFPETFSQLQKNIQSNGLSKKVKLNALALADQTGTRNMDLTEGPSQSRGLLKDTDPEGLKVETSTLSDFLHNIGQNEVDMLKIDIEGGEHEVFQSATPEVIQKIKYIAMEYHPNAPKEGLFNKIQSSNFTLIHDYPISGSSGVAYFQRN